MLITRDSYINSLSPIEKELKLLFDKNENLIIFDIGSCEGEDSIKYARMFPNAKILAFEALPNNVNLIEKNIEKYSAKNIEVLPFALSDEDGETDFFVSSGQFEEKQTDQDWDYGNKSSSIFPPDKNLEKIIPWLNFNEVIKVKMRTIQSICAEKHISSVDFIHMDVQGAELNVLKGSGNLIKDFKVIWLEVEAVELYKGQPLKSDIEKFMKKNGFYKLKDSVNKISGDQLYINKKYIFTNLKTLKNSVAIRARFIFGESLRFLKRRVGFILLSVT